MSVSRIGEFHAATNQVDALRDFLKSILPIIRSSQGCVSCQLLQDQEDAAKFVMIEVWDSVRRRETFFRFSYSAFSPNRWMILYGLTHSV